ncbi:Xaa-Pro_dipeptidase [Hexamita inflata]|uniref:Xaa-Pro_dipeptidase n=1 Tax=Hexamita inflata TaxID=28002 RepID=A0ABP1IA85_9EUKA
MFAQHRENLYKVIGNDLAFLKGGVSACWYDTDTDIKFRQESNFYYLTGCLEPDYLALFDGSKKEFTLFVPRLGAEHELWCGKVTPIEKQKELYNPTHIKYVDEFDQVAANYKALCHVILDIPQIPNQTLPFEQKNDLHALLAELRIFKDEKEVEEMRLSCSINAKAFNYTMGHLKTGMLECEAEALHAYTYLKNGARFPSFCSITASGANSSTLHFVDNSHVIQAGQTFLLDAGCEVRNTCSDHTRTFPVNEKFTQKQETLYRVVLAANKKGIELAKPGVKWEDVHLGSLRVLLQGLREAGLVNKNLSEDEQHELGIASIFQPHGLGHMLGLNTHDVGGYNSEIKKNTSDVRIKYLRTRRTLQEGMILTIEPGLYFIDGMLDAAKADPNKAKHLNFEVIAEYRKECGGYRIEDDIYITKTGCEVMPGAVKEVEEIHALRKLAYI